MNSKYDRRDFLKLGAGVGAGLAMGNIALSGCASQLAAWPPTEQLKPIETVRIGFVGVGNMGSSHVTNLLRIEGVRLTAVCDIVPEKVARIQSWVVDAGQAKPAGYSRGERDFERMCASEDIDLVYTATPWRWHVPVCVAAMKNGKHAATEVPAAVTIDECWQLVETAEKTNRHCVMMENCCYDRVELMILNMARQGVLGELLHAECGYLHDLRAEKFATDNQGNWVSEAIWRRDHSVTRNGDLYPTHGLGPVAQCMNVNRGNLFSHLVSMSCNSRGLNLFAAEKFGTDTKWAKQKYALGDVVTTLIHTLNGQTIVLTHDTNTPRPYSRDILVQGTKGIVRKYPEEKIFLEAKSPHHQWEPLSKYAKQYEHPLWKTMQELAEGAGHGGMDFIEDYRLIKCLREGKPTDMDVYDAAALSAISEASERSIAGGNKPVKIPDFTRGRWKSRAPLGIVGA